MKLQQHANPVLAGRKVNDIQDDSTKAVTNKKWLYIELPCMDYRDVLNLQQSIVAARNDKVIETDMVLLVEHPPVFTLGRNGKAENLSVSNDFLQKAGIQVIRVERGGDITYHGPGQLVVYPIVNLNKAGMKVETYISAMEEIMILTAAQWGIKAKRNRKNRGVWVGNKKLGSVGIAIRHSISFHGFSLNVNNALDPFEWINPCGLKDVKMTSMKKECKNKDSLTNARKAVMHNLAHVFDVDLLETDLGALEVGDWAIA